MGSHKHGISGVAPKSPRCRMMERLDAERKEKAKRPKTKMYDSIKELCRDKND